MGYVLTELNLWYMLTTISGHTNEPVPKPGLCNTARAQEGKKIFSSKIC